MAKCNNLLKRFFSKKEIEMIHNVNFAFGKVHPWIKEKVKSAKSITLAELEKL